MSLLKDLLRNRRSDSLVLVSLVLVSLALVPLAFAGCSSPEPRVQVNCDGLDSLSGSGIDLSAAQKAFVHEETTRMLRYREALDPGYFMQATTKYVRQSEIDRGAFCFEQLQTVGRLLFEHEYSFADGLSNSDAKTRPDPFRRIHKGSFGGPETNACVSCHWRGGEAGAGALQDNSFVNGDGVNTYSAEARNPPSLLGSGVVQALAQEMSAELQAQRAAAILRTKKSGESEAVQLVAKGIRFGSLTISPGGRVDSSKLEGVDPDLVIKPFGWRGEFRTIREFSMTSTQVHLGIQSEDLLVQNAASPSPLTIGDGSSKDPDNDGVSSELSSGQLTSLVIYLASLPMPILAPPKMDLERMALTPAVESVATRRFEDRFLTGQNLFESTGCVLCHTPMLVLEDPTFVTTSRTTGKSYRVDLSEKGRQPRLQYSEALKGYPVWLFSDMKRHDLGDRAKGQNQNNSQHGSLGESEFLSRRLWGLGESPPYFYDGRAPTVDLAILAHDGEAAFAREEFEELNSEDKGSLRLFLLGLGRGQDFVVP